MNPNEKETLENFLKQLKATQTVQKDSEANELIVESTKHQADAAYLLVQRAMGLELALQVAQKQIAELQAQVAGKSNASFLGDNNSWGRAASPATSNNAISPARPSGAPAAQPSAWGSGMLGTIATTAVGVVAGSMLYQGIQSMLGHQQSPAHSDSLSSIGNNDMHTASYDQNQDLADFDSDFGGDGFA
jgi:uncharacterized protein